MDIQFGQLDTLSFKQLSAVIEGKHVLGTAKEIVEVLNAFAAYELMDSLNPFEVADLLTAHKILMLGLVTDDGRFRSGVADIYRGEINWFIWHRLPRIRYRD